MESTYIRHVEPNSAVHGATNDETVIAITTAAEDSAQASAANEIDKPKLEIGFIIFIFVLQAIKWILFKLRRGGNAFYIDIALVLLDVTILVSLVIKGCCITNRGKNRRLCCWLSWLECGFLSLLLVLQVIRIVLTFLRAGAKPGKTLWLDIAMGAIDVALLVLMVIKFVFVA